MAILDQANVAIDLEELQNLLPEMPLRRTSVDALQSSFDQAADDLAARPADVDSSRSTLVDFRTVCWHRIRTIAPLVAADLLALGLSGLLAGGVLHLFDPHSAPVVGPAVVVLFLLVFAYWLCGLYSGFGIHPVLELRQLIQVNTIGFAAAAVGGILAPPLLLWCVVAWMASVGLVPFCRALARRRCARCSWWGYPTLIISSGASAEAVALALLRAPTSGLRPIAVTHPDGDSRSSLLPVVNDRSALESLVRSRTIRYAVVSLPEISHSRLVEVYNRYATLVPHLLVLSDSNALPSLWGTSRSCGRLSGVEMRNGRMLATLWFVKRLIDLAVATTALCASLPLLITIAALVKLTSRGPVFYGHRRIGFSGSRFMAWKFRTMHPDSDAVLHDYLDRNPEARLEWELHHKLRDDPRVTPLGRFLRKSSLDELPQIWNVLKGEMSLVGPRPIVAGEVEKYGNVFRLISTVKPGITGLWQVSGRTDVSYAERVRLDQYYVANWSPWLDIYILAKTVVILIRRNGAY